MSFHRASIACDYQFCPVMDSVNAGHSEPHSLPLLKLIGKGNHTSVAQFWEESTFPWDANRVYYRMCRGLESYREQNLKTAEDMLKVTALHQLREILVYESERLPLKDEKTQLLNAAVRDFEENYDQITKHQDTEERLQHADWIMKAMCYHHPKLAFERCPNPRNGSQNSYLPSAFQFAVTTKSIYILQIILDELVASFERDNLTYSEHQPQSNQPQQVICDTKKAADENMVEIVELLLKNSASLPHDIEYKVMGIIDMMVGKNSGLLNERTWKIVVTTPLPNFAHRLLESRDSGYLTEAHATFAAEKGTASMWQMFPEQVRRASVSAQDFGLLRKLILSRRVDMAKAIFELDAAFIDASIEAEGYEILLQHLKGIKKGSAIKDLNGIYGTIRNLLICSMIRSRNLGFQDMRDILQRLESMSKLYHLPTCRLLQ